MTLTEWEARKLNRCSAVTGEILLDTQLLLWAANDSARLGDAARAIIGAPDNELFFSAASLWEITIKRGLGRVDFQIDARVLRRGLLDNGYSELPITSEHAVAIESLPPIHKDLRQNPGGASNCRRYHLADG